MQVVGHSLLFNPKRVVRSKLHYL